MPYFFLFLAFVVNGLASVFLKVDTLVSRAGVVGIFDWALSHRFFFFGLVAFAVNFIFYWLALRSLSLSVAYPIMVAGSFIVVSMCAAVIFREHISAVQTVGYLCIFGGVLLVLLYKPV